MSEPQRFEVYSTFREPDLPDAPSDSGPRADALPEFAPGVQPARKLSRRRVLGLAIGLPVAAGLAGAIAVVGQSRSETSNTVSSTAAEPADLGSGSFAVGPYSAILPDGWDVLTSREDEVVIGRGANQLLASTLVVGADDQAADVLGPLVRSHCGAFTGSLSDPVDMSDGTMQRAVVTADGWLSAKPARLEGRIWIDHDNNALLLVQVLTAKKGTAVDKAVDGLVAELSGGF